MPGIQLVVEPRVLPLTIEKPSKLGRRGKGKKESSTTFAMRNQSDDPVTFKVRTNQPTRYTVTPSAGLIEADGDMTVTITVVETELEGIIANHKDITDPLAPPDRFLVQSLPLSDKQRRALMGSDTREDTIEEFWDSQEPATLPDGVKLRVKFTIPNDVLIAAGISKMAQGEDQDDEDEEQDEAELWLKDQETQLDMHAQQLKERLAVEIEERQDRDTLPLPTNAEEFQAELDRLNEKYNTLIANSLELTSERNQLRHEADALLQEQAQEEKEMAEADGEGKDDASSQGPQVGCPFARNALPLFFRSSPLSVLACS